MDPALQRDDSDVNLSLDQELSSRACREISIAISTRVFFVIPNHQPRHPEAPPCHPEFISGSK